MKIETYSQSYQLPSEQLLDELIEGYGKTDAAGHLLKVRQQVIRAVEQNDVVTCAFMDETSTTIDDGLGFTVV